MKQSKREYKRIVIKIGSSLFFSETGGFDKSLFRKIGEQVVTLRKAGKEVVLVSSGAIALGMRTIGLKTRPRELSYLQAAAAIGQNVLMDHYSSFFREHNIHCAQILLTWDDFNDRRRYLNAKNTLLTLFKLGTVPIINENDTVSTEEIKFGDNDQLSARVVSLIRADELIILSDVEGLLDREKKVIRVVSKITPAIRSLACPTRKTTCVGGMITKIDAARVASGAGAACVIASGLEDDTIVKNVEDPGASGTLFLPAGEALAEKKRWIAFGTKPQGAIVIDEGARAALINKKSLLCVGVVGVTGHFESGDIVSVVSGGCEIARGKAGLSSSRLDEIKGRRHDKEVIHRDNIAVVS